MISILMPVHNAADWLDETIQSIVDQSYEDWELIAIDDFSTDESLQLLKNWNSKDSRVRPFSNIQKGIIPALQLALKESKGEFVTRFDADDLMPKNRLELFLNEIVKVENSLVTGKVEYFSDSKVSAGYLKYQNWLNERIENNDFYYHIYRECVIASPNWLIRKEDLLKNKIFDNLQYPEDYDMVFQWFQSGIKIKPIDEVTLHWREHPKRTSRNSLVYEQKSFFKLKLDWFKKLNQAQFKSIGILGANNKSKMIIDQLLDFELSLYDLNWKKRNQDFNGYQVRDYNLVDQDCLLIAIYPERRDELESFIKNKGYQIGLNAWYV